MSMNLNMNRNKLLSGALALGIVLDVGCGGTIDLAKLKQTDGSGSTNSSAGSTGGGYDVGTAGDSSEGGLAGYSGNSGAPNAGAPNAGAPNAGAPNAGAPNAGAPNAGGPGEDTTSCAVDHDCVDCETLTDPNVSGCYIPCCTVTAAMNRTACEQNRQNFMASCPQIGCSVACAYNPPPLCVNGQCVASH